MINVSLACDKYSLDLNIKKKYISTQKVDVYQTLNIKNIYQLHD